MTDFKRTKSQFHIPDDIIYLDGNSLGVLPKSAASAAAKTITDQWGEMLITAWNRAGWMELPARLGDMIAPLIGASMGTITTGDTLSIKVYQALHAALRMRPERRVVLSDSGNFPSDLYMAQGLLETLDKDYELRVVAPEDIKETIDNHTAAVMLTHVDYKTGRMHDINTITQTAHDNGAVMIWDLAHSAGAININITASNAEFAIGCSYKYLNGGPGAPAFIYVRPDIVSDINPALAGWLGHNAPFDFDANYRPAGGIARMRVGTPPIIQMRILEAAMTTWQDVNMDDLRDESIKLSEAFINGIEAACPDWQLISPLDPNTRGSQVSFAHPDGYAIVQALIERGVVGDFRAPNLMRFGFTPLYIDETDITRATQIIHDVYTSNIWREARFQTRSAVT